MASGIDLPVVLISIHPEYAEAILSGRKKVELRRVPVREQFQFLALYATAPMKAIVGFCRVRETVSASPSWLWEHYGSVSGVTRRVFREYFRGCRTGYVFVIAETARCEPPLPLANLGVPARAPQSFAYVPERSFGLQAQILSP
jgi:predicted transcriptional regulator